MRWTRPTRTLPGAAPPAAPAHPPLVIAHRGDSASEAEHTLAAYAAAIDGGADGLECDVRMTRDGHLVCVHDRRIDRTSNGTGTVSDLSLAELQALDFASWKEDWPETADALVGENPYLEGVRPERVTPDGSVLTLEMLLALAADAGRPVRLAIETKHPTRYAGLVEKELVRVLRRFGHGRGTPPERQTVAVMSFAATALRRVRLLAPALPTVYLTHRRPESPPTGTRIAGPSVTSVRGEPEFVARMHARGNQVYVWTVDAPADVERMLDLGVDAIITNRPRDVLAARAARTGDAAAP